MAVRTHDVPGDSAGKAIPCGVYDGTADAGWVNAGTDHDTAAFAVESIRRWWKAGLAAPAEETGLQVTCCHFPPGTCPAPPSGTSAHNLAATPG